MKKVLITGITGFVGQYLAQELSGQGYEVSGTFRTPDQKFSEKFPHILLKQLDLLNPDAVDALIDEIKPDVIFHLAAQASPAESFKDPANTFLTNINAQLHIFEALRQKELFDTRVFVISTSEVYGIVLPQDIPVDEETQFRPGSPYAVSKIAQDFLGLQYFLSYKMPIVRVRPFNHIGPGQLPKFVVPQFARQIAEIEKNVKEPIMKVGNLEAKRDFTDVRDIVKAYTLLIDKGVPGEVYNIGQGVSVKVRDILEKLIALSNKTIAVEQDPALLRPSDVPDIVCDSTKLKNLTGWAPSISLDQTLKDTLDYWRAVV